MNEDEEKQILEYKQKFIYDSMIKEIHEKRVFEKFIQDSSII